ncbi:MAG: FAD-dependent oxidoreductase, partial [Intestinibacter sp.]
MYNWPYENEFDKVEEVTSDVLILGGGLAGCYAAIAAARKGQSVVVVEKGATVRLENALYTHKRYVKTL